MPIVDPRQKGSKQAPTTYVSKLYHAIINWIKKLTRWRPEVAGATFSDSDSTPVPKFLNPGPGPDPAPAIFQIWKSDYCTDSGYNHPSNRKFAHVFPNEMTTQTPATAEIEKWLRIRVRFSQIFDFGSEKKTQNPAGVDSGTPDPVPTLVKTKIDQIIKCSCTVNIRHILRQKWTQCLQFPFRGLRKIPLFATLCKKIENSLDRKVEESNASKVTWVL